MNRSRGATRSRNGRFAPRFSAHELLTIVREICALIVAATGGDPLRVTQTAYDEALSRSPYADSPRAFRIAATFKTSWSRVLEVAHKHGVEFEQSIAALLGRDAQDLSEEAACDALGAIATRLGVDTIRPDAYDVELGVLIEEQRRAWLHGQPIADSFPSSARIDAKFGWDAILVTAGLTPRPRAGRIAGTPRHGKGTWSCERCVESLITALNEFAVSNRGQRLGQREYRRLKDGRADLAAMSAVTDAAKTMDTTFSAIRAEIVAWRLGPRDRPPAILELARRVDAERLLHGSEPLLAAAHRAQAEFTARWEAELIAALAELGRPASRREVAEATGWAGPVTGKRLRAAAERGVVVMTNIGQGVKTTRWARA